jgi:hypothetical protein
MKKNVARGIPAAGTREQALASIMDALDACRAWSDDDSVAYELRELDALKAAVEDHWPLRMETKDQMNLGPFAAKNISDWNSGLADLLMHLDFELRHDGASLFGRKPSLTDLPLGEEPKALDRARRA